MKNILILFSLIIIIGVSCVKPNDPDNGKKTYLTGRGVFIINEGNFRWGNGTVSFFSYDSAKIYNDIFNKINGRILGDVPNSLAIFGDMCYIVVNNSGKIEVVDSRTFESITTITDLISPRNIKIVNTEKAYITSMYSDSISILDIKNNTISGYINIERKSEAIAVSGNLAFIASWIGDKFITVININTDKVVSSIEVGMEPESIALDKNNKLWVLCNGGWARSNFAELIRINVQNLAIEKKFYFPLITDSPNTLVINGNKDSIFYIDNGIRCMNILSDKLPDQALVPQTDHFFYKLAINPENGDILVTDAVDYQQNGYLLFYNSKGKLKQIEQTGIIPGNMYFTKNSSN